MTLADAIIGNNKKQFLQLLDDGENIEEIDVYGFTPLIETAVCNNLDFAKVLVERGAKVNEHDLTGGTALQWAVENNNIEFVSYLLNKGADPNSYSKSSQPVLFKPLLRYQQKLKKLLYEYGADLIFAQDYINAKLIGHRFELIGRVYIPDNHQKMVEVDFEGFILEFTLSLIQHSLTEFKKHYAARHLKPYFPDIKIIIDAVGNAVKALKYQQYLTDLNKQKDRIFPLLNKDCLVLPVGYEGHAICFIRLGNLFAKIDRGELSLSQPSVIISRIKNPKNLTTDFISHLLYKSQNKHSVTDGIDRYLGLEPIDDLPLPSQITGNCSWANIEAILPTLLYMLYYQQDLGEHRNLIAYKKIVMGIFHEWQAWDRNRAIHQCINNFNDSDKARKISKASILTAVLFQTFDYKNSEDIKQANKIVPLLSDPDVDYVIKSYIEIYVDKHKTPKGQNLVHLLDLCGYGGRM